jgi:transcriptional regulator with XRE-family HTH domain
MNTYQPSYAARVRDLSMAGLKDAEIARLLGVSLTTLHAWEERYPEFASAWRDGRLQADAMVVGALFKKACGYKINKYKETKDGIFREEVIIPVDTAACIFWLTNRQADMWKPKSDENPGGRGTLIVDDMDDLEAARRIAFVLAKATQDLIGEQSNDQANPPETE